MFQHPLLRVGIALIDSVVPSLSFMGLVYEIFFFVRDGGKARVCCFVGVRGKGLRKLSSPRGERCLDVTSIHLANMPVDTSGF